MNDNHKYKNVLKSLKNVLKKLELFNAFLLVVRFGSRFTQDDLLTVNILKTIFGDDFLRKCCILLVTCGDYLESPNKRSVSFEHWCDSQEGNFKYLYEECCKRAILFHNKTQDRKILTDQLNSLIIMVDNLKNSGVAYTLKNFLEVKNRPHDRTTLFYEVTQSNFLERLMKCTEFTFNKVTRNGKPKEDEVEPIEDTLQDIQKILGVFDIFLFVFQFGSRFLDDTFIVNLKSFFGEDFFSRYCIILLSFGDNFDPNESESFDSWCLKQEGLFKELMNECEGRVLLFDNKTHDAAKKKDQKDKLFSMVDTVIRKKT
ncbi:hypothetical protein Btru_072645 [Bulinus truncatus]|nr:hypothetical protein Btru_072645 [Bulinus truncatus]